MFPNRGVKASVPEECLGLVRGFEHTVGVDEKAIAGLNARGSRSVLRGHQSDEQAVAVENVERLICGAPVQQWRMARSGVRDFATLTVQVNAHGGEQLPPELAIQCAAHGREDRTGIVRARVADLAATFTIEEITAPPALHVQRRPDQERELVCSGDVQEIIEISSDFGHRQVADIEPESFEGGHAVWQDRLLNAPGG